MARKRKEIKFVSGIKKSPYDIRDYKYEKLVAAVMLPSKFDCRDKLFGIKDQGFSSECSAFTASQMKEYQEVIDVGLTEQLSPQYVYDYRSNHPYLGMDPRNTMKILVNYGICTEKEYPFTGSNISRVPEQLKEKGLIHKSKGFARVYSVEGVKQAMFNHGPVYVGLPVYNTGFRFWKQDGDYVSLGGHAALFVAYDDEKRVLILRNSWGKDWYTGDVIFPYDDWDSIWESWSTIDEKNVPEPIPEWKQKLQKFWNSIIRIYQSIKGFIKRIFN